MNSLTENDYSKDSYETQIVQIGKQMYWERPLFELTKFQTDQWEYQDAFKLRNPQFQNENVSASRFSTRIDYIYLHSLEKVSWSLKECFLINICTVTDHSTTFASFEKNRFEYLFDIIEIVTKKASEISKEVFCFQEYDFF